MKSRLILSLSIISIMLPACSQYPSIATIAPSATPEADTVSGQSQAAPAASGAAKQDQPADIAQVPVVTISPPSPDEIADLPQAPVLSPPGEIPVAAAPAPVIPAPAISVVASPQPSLPCTTDLQGRPIPPAGPNSPNWYRKTAVPLTFSFCQRGVSPCFPSGAAYSSIDWQVPVSTLDRDVSFFVSLTGHTGQAPLQAQNLVHAVLNGSPLTVDISKLPMMPGVTFPWSYVYMGLLGKPGVASTVFESLTATLSAVCYDSASDYVYVPPNFSTLQSPPLQLPLIISGGWLDSTSERLPDGIQN